MDPFLPVFSFALTAWLNRRRGPGPQWADLAFMYGRWRTDRVKTARIWRPARGDCDFFALDDGQVFTRRNRGSARDEAGRRRPVCDPVLRMFFDEGALKADCVIDGETMHFEMTALEPGREVVLTARPRPNGPVFRLRYQRADRRTLASELALAAPGSPDFRPVLAEALIRRR